MQNGIDKLVKDISETYKKTTWTLELGIFEDELDRPKYRNNKGKIVSKVDPKDGLTNAQLLFIHEHGSPLNHIPRRRILYYAIQDVKNNGMLEEEIKFINEKMLFDNWNEAQVTRELKIFAKRIAQYCKELVNNKDPRIKPNSPRTIAKKKSDIPLINTRQMIRAIDCRLVKIK